MPKSSVVVQYGSIPVLCCHRTNEWMCACFVAYRCGYYIQYVQIQYTATSIDPVSAKRFVLICASFAWCHIHIRWPRYIFRYLCHTLKCLNVMHVKSSGIFKQTEIFFFNIKLAFCNECRCIKSVLHKCLSSSHDWREYSMSMATFASIVLSSFFL